MIQKLEKNGNLISISELIDIMLRSCFSSILVRSLSPSNQTGLSIIFDYTVLFQVMEMIISLGYILGHYKYRGCYSVYRVG